jgi:hypothetical protein
MNIFIFDVTKMNDKEKIELKQLFWEKAIEILHARIEQANKAMNEAQQAANSEDKSSVGDKYETARAMALIDRDIHARQLESAQKDHSFIQHVDPTLLHKSIEVGACAQTDHGNYFFLTGLGPIEIGKEKIFFLSISSPVGKHMTGKIAGDRVYFNGKEITIKNVF